MKGYLYLHLFKVQECSVRWGFSPKPVTLKVHLLSEWNKVIDHNTEEFVRNSVAALQVYINAMQPLIP